MKRKDAKGRETSKKSVVGFQVIENECIWMKAGIVNFHLCDNAYDCYNCPFDKGMRKAMGMDTSSGTERERPGWVQYLQKRYTGASRPCRHALTGRVSAPKICTLNYECHHCPYDQMLDELDLTQISPAPNYMFVSGFRMASGYYYHLGHSWVRFEHGGRTRVGFDDFAVKVFGAVQELSLPPLGATLKQDQVGWTLGRDDRKAAVLSPVTGTLLAKNQKVQEHPQITTEDPYQEGWLFILEPEIPKRNLKRLYFENESYRWMEQESQNLLSLMGNEYEKLAATGGEVIQDVYGHYPELGWDNLVKAFLRTEKL